MIKNFSFWKKTKKSLREELLQNSEVFCMAPWVGMHISTKGQAFPCCLSASYEDGAVGNIKGSSVSQIWNSDNMMRLRKDMKEGRRNPLCTQCYKYQDMGGTSSRDEHNTEFAKHFDLVENHTTDDGYLEKFEVKVFDFRFSNLCNFSCRICSHRYSSSWFKEASKLGLADPGANRVIVPIEDPEELWQKLLPLLPHLERIHFAGGEPLIMEPHYRILNYFVENEMFDVGLSYNTNFSETKFKNQDVFQLWKMFKQVSVCASLDGMGARGEFMRKGQNWSQTVENRKRLLEECPNVTFELAPTISIMNVLHLPDFVSNWLDNGLLRPNELKIYLIFEPHFYNTQNLSNEYKARVAKRYKEFLGHYQKKFQPSDYVNLETQFTRVLNHMNGKTAIPENSYSRFTFSTFNQELDKMREENMIEVFPELKEVTITKP